MGKKYELTEQKIKTLEFQAGQAYEALKRAISAKEDWDRQ